VKRRSHRYNDDSWVELNAKDYESKIDGGRRADAGGHIGRSDSEEDILPERHNIMITTETMIESSSR